MMSQLRSDFLPIPYLDMAALTQQYQPQLQAAITTVITSGQYLHGAQVAAFEAAFANYCGVTHCIGVANGLDALYIILTALKRRYKWDDKAEIILPDFTFIATAQAVLRAGLCPVFCDVQLDTALLDPVAVSRHISPRTVALLPVHLYGKVCNMDELQAIATAHKLLIIEDAAQSHGATYHGHRAGSLGIAAGFSFYPGKNLGALGDAGAITTSDTVLANECRIIANYGTEGKYHYVQPGINSRMDELQAAVLYTKLPYLEKDNAHRRILAAIYSEIRHPQLRIYLEGKVDESAVYHIHPIFCMDRKACQNYLTAHGVSTLIHYPAPLHHIPFLSPYAEAPACYPHSTRLAQCTLSLPISPVLPVTSAHHIVDLLKQLPS